MTRTTHERWMADKKIKEIRKDFLFSCPEKEYIDFIIVKTADFFKIKPEEIISKRRMQYILIPRYFVIKLINEFTSYKDEAMYFVQRDRTTWGNAVRETDNFLLKRYYDNAYKNLKAICRPEAFENYKLSQVKKVLTHNWETFKEAQNER